MGQKAGQAEGAPHDAHPSHPNHFEGPCLSTSRRGGHRRRLTGTRPGRLQRGQRERRRSLDNGSTAVFITDAPSDDFDRILVTIECLELIGDDGHVTIFSGHETIDLKDLENFSDLFVYAEERPGRLLPQDPDVRHEPSASCAKARRPEVIDVDPPAGGKIDLLSKEKFQIHPGITLVTRARHGRQEVDPLRRDRERQVPVPPHRLRDDPRYATSH